MQTLLTLRKLFLVMVSAIGLWLGTALPSFAFFHIGVSYPVSFNYTGIDSSEKDTYKLKNDTGFGLDVVLPFGLMFRYDTFVQKYKAFPDGSDNRGKNTIQLFSAGYRFDLPAVPIHFAGALGVGSDTFNNGTKNLKAGTPTQLYLEAGYNIMPVFDIYLGLHSIMGNKIKDAVTTSDGTTQDSKSKMSATALSLGFNVGF